MTSFITTMFVQPPSFSIRALPSFGPASPKPLDPVFSLAELSSCSHLPILACTGSSDPAHPRNHPAEYVSPSQRVFRCALRSTPSQPNLQPFTLPSPNMDNSVNYNSSLHSNSRTRAPFKPQKARSGTSSWQLKQFAEATLGSGSLRKAVKLPEGEDENEWLAVNGKSE
jgi:hypothetical protein